MSYALEQNLFIEIVLILIAHLFTLGYETFLEICPWRVSEKLIS